MSRPAAPSAVTALALSWALIVLSCTGEPVPPPQPTPPSEENVAAWDEIRRQIRDAGDITPEVALTEFATMFGPLPGVEQLPGGIPRGVSGTSAVRHVLRHWESLSAEQRKVIEADIFGSIKLGGTTSSAGVPLALLGPVAVLPAEETQERIDEIARELAPSAGWLSRSALYSSELARNPTGTFLAFARPAVEEDGSWRQATDDDRDWRCVITLTQNGRALTGAELDSTLAHEVFHCIQFEVLGPQLGVSLPDWLAEGSAEWVGEEFVGGTAISEPFWKQYFNEDVPLFERSYDAIGFYGHMAYTGVDPWTNLVPMLQTRDPDAAFSLVAGTAGLLDTWPTGRARFGEFYGPAWDTDGPGLTLDIGADIEEVDVEPGGDVTLTTQPGHQQLYKILFPSEGAIEVQATGHGGWLWDSEGEPTQPFGGSFEARWSLGGPPACPEGEGATGVGVAPTRQALIGLTGSLEGATLTIAVLETAEALCDSAGPGPGAGTPPPQSGESPCPDCPTACDLCGRGASWGEPHLRSFDGLAYDFQGAGEFVLAQAVDGGLQVQVRYRALSRVSVGDAIAVLAGADRVGIYLQDQSPGQPTSIRINGFPHELASDAVELPGGGGSVRELATESVERHRLEIEMADGSAVLARIYGGHMDFEVVLPPALSGQVVGLLGNFDGDPSNDLASRGGSAVPPDDADFDYLYGEYGPSWRVVASESLFDYDSGESPDSFWNPDFPPGPVSVDDLTSEQREAAEVVCLDAGVVEQPYLDNCILDLALTGEDDYVFSAQETQATLAIDDLIGGWISADEHNEVDVRHDLDGTIVGRIVETDLPCLEPGSVIWRITDIQFPLEGEATRVRIGALAPRDCAERVFAEAAEFRLNQIDTRVLIANGIDPRTPTLRISCETLGCGDWIKKQP